MIMSIKNPTMIYKLFEQYTTWDQREGTITGFALKNAEVTPDKIYEHIKLNTVFKITYTVDDGERPSTR